MIQINETVLKDTLKGFRIPPKPEILVRIEEIATSSDPNITEVAQIISQDVGISSAILTVINSPAYGMNRAISDVKQAVIILGFDPVIKLVTAIKLQNAFPSDCCISLELFWDNAVEIANAMVYIGSQLENKVPPEDLYSLGLFHDAGIPALACKYPDYKDALQAANSDNQGTLVDFEEAKYPTNHAIVGYFLSNSWNLPRDLCQVILHHHDMSFFSWSEAQSNHVKMAILKLAENIVFSKKRFMETPEWISHKDVIMGLLLLDEDSLADLVDDITESELS
jgi:HD-like signal output (HDOD) protein